MNGSPSCARTFLLASDTTLPRLWGDLEHLFDWAAARDLNVLQLTTAEISQYLAWLRRRQYSQNTIRRRLTTFSAFYEHARNSGEP